MAGEAAGLTIKEAKIALNPTPSSLIPPELQPFKTNQVYRHELRADKAVLENWTASHAVNYLWALTSLKNEILVHKATKQEDSDSDPSDLQRPTFIRLFQRNLRVHKERGGVSLLASNSLKAGAQPVKPETVIEGLFKLLLREDKAVAESYYNYGSDQFREIVARLLSKPLIPKSSSEIEPSVSKRQDLKQACTILKKLSDGSSNLLTLLKARQIIRDLSTETAETETDDPIDENIIEQDHSNKQKNIVSQKNSSNKEKSENDKNVDSNEKEGVGAVQVLKILSGYPTSNFSENMPRISPRTVYYEEFGIKEDMLPNTADRSNEAHIFWKSVYQQYVRKAADLPIEEKVTNETLAHSKNLMLNMIRDFFESSVYYTPWLPNCNPEFLYQLLGPSCYVLGILLAPSFNILMQDSAKYIEMLRVIEQQSSVLFVILLHISHNLFSFTINGAPDLLTKLGYSSPQLLCVFIGYHCNELPSILRACPETATIISELNPILLSTLINTAPEMLIALAAVNESVIASIDNVSRGILDECLVRYPELAENLLSSGSRILYPLLSTSPGVLLVLARITPDLVVARLQQWPDLLHLVYSRQPRTLFTLLHILPQVLYIVAVQLPQLHSTILNDHSHLMGNI